MIDLPAVFSDLVRFETELWNAIDGRLRSELDLPLSRFEPMQIIAHRPHCRVFDISDELSITVGGTSKLVDRIESTGHCRRRPNPEDRRSSYIELTPAGETLLAQATAIFTEELHTRLGDVVSARSLEQFHATLNLLRTAGHSDSAADSA